MKAQLFLLFTFLGQEILAQSSSKHAIPYSCLPSQPCWPTAAEWDAFNGSINGRLGATGPWARVCYTDPSSPACQAVEKGYSQENARQSVYGVMENINWETCGFSNQCLLNTSDPTALPTQDCSLGRLSAYYVRAQTTDDIIKTLAFVRQHDLRLSIKNSGHDYSGRSSAANSLALWVQGMKNMSYQARFDQYNGKKGIKNVGIVSAGVSSGEASDFFAMHNMQAVLGVAPTVGLAGGFGQAGGHGALAPSHGLAVDQAVEFDVILANGTQLTINDCNNPDLFYAMRGGAAGTYAVMVNYKLRLHRAVPFNTYTFIASILPSAQTKDLTKSAVLRTAVTALAKNQTNWSNNRVAGYTNFSPNLIATCQILPSNDTKKLQALTDSWRKALTALPGLNVTVSNYTTFSTQTDFVSYYNTLTALNVPVGVGIAAGTRLIPRTLFDPSVNASYPAPLVDAFLAGMQQSLSGGQGLTSGFGTVYATGPANHPDNSATGVNPAWRGSIWETIFLGVWTSPDNRTTRANTYRNPGKALEPIVDLTPGGGTYFNEGDLLTEDWQQAFFGCNYDKLLAIKKLYDPTNLFNCWKCVGWNGDNDPFYSCYNLDVDGVPTVPQTPLQQPVAPVAR